MTFDGRAAVCQTIGRSNVRLAVVDTTTQWPELRRHTPRSVPLSASVADVEAEARRRLRSVKLNEWRTREFVTGQPVPDQIRHFALQVEFAAQAISHLSPIPADFDSDIYWPRALDL
jgi:hypothetical protein